MARDDPELEALIGRLDPEVSGRLRELIEAQIVREARALLVKRFTLGAARSGHLRLGGLETGLWRVDGLCAEELKLKLAAEGVALEHSRIELDLMIELGFQIPRLTSPEPRTLKVGPAPGRVTTPTLRRIDLSYLAKGMGLSFVLKSICADEAVADVAPLGEIDAGSGRLGGVAAEGVSLELPGELGGVDLGRLVLERLGLDGLSAPKVTIERLGASGEIRTKGVMIRNASVGSAKVGTVAGGKLDLDFEVGLPKMKIKTFPDLPESLRRLTTRVWVEVTPKLIVHIGNLVLEGLTLETEVGRVFMDELRLPFSLSDIEALEVALEGIGLTEATVG